MCSHDLWIEPNLCMLLISRHVVVLCMTLVEGIECTGVWCVSELFSRVRRIMEVVVVISVLRGSR